LTKNFSQKIEFPTKDYLKTPSLNNLKNYGQFINKEISGSRKKKEKKRI